MPMVLLDRIRVRGFDDQVAEVLLVPNSTNIKIISFRTPPGLKGYVTNFGQAWDAGINTFVKFYLKVNGAVVYPYNGLFVQITPPEAASNYPLPSPIPLEQLSLVECYADVGAAAGNGNFAARIICKYYDIKDVLTI